MISFLKIGKIMKIYIFLKYLQSRAAGKEIGKRRSVGRSLRVEAGVV